MFKLTYHLLSITKKKQGEKQTRTVNCAPEILIGDNDLKAVIE